MADDRCYTADAVREVLASLSFSPSCVDMGWAWSVDCAKVLDDDGDTAAHGFTIQCSFQRPDREHGGIGTGYGRRWWVDSGATESAIIKTAWLAGRQIVEHEMMEAFKVDGLRPWDPHRTIAELVGGVKP